ncbi:MAG: hypothetical protein KIH10_16940 [Candidatus Freyarchaeota archaeon]|nr:hypothetical protein [Candidatus Jordarchaeia archaeon]MBS7281293.1 hypothetical protein [Candidatus Jordarchaeia archaeon]
MGEYVYDVGFIDGVKAEDISVGEKLRVKVTGGWPSPAWEFDHEEVEVEGDRITVKVVGRVKLGVVALTVIEPFEHVVEVENLREGVYTVEAVGRGENSMVKVSVHPAKQVQEGP